MSYSKLILRDYADITWPLDDISKTSSFSYPINFFGPNNNSYSASININNTSVLSIPMIYGGGKLLQFNNASVGLSVPALGRFSELYKDKNSVISFWIKIDSINSEEQPIFKKRNQLSTGLFIKDNYLIFKFGSSADYSVTVAPITELNDPHHVIVGAGSGYRSIILDGIEHTPVKNSSKYPEYLLNDDDVLDFYGPQNGLWQIDAITFFPNLISTNIAKKHYIYGLGKWIDDSIFYSLGGYLYNFSTIETRKIASISWDYPEEWQLTEFKDLQADDFGIKPINFNEPELITFDNNISTENNKIKFSSNEITLTSYIDVNRIFNKIQDGSYPIFVKFKLDGELPDNELSQRLVSYGNIPDFEIMGIDLYNNNGQYQIIISAIDFPSTASFNIINVSSSPDIYVGFQFDGESKFYFAESGSSVQTTKFDYISASGYGLDPLYSHFPPKNNSVVRIGGTMLYDLKNNTPLSPFDYKQFYGSFKKFMVVQSNDINSLTTFTSLEEYRKIRYGFTYDSSDERFLVSTYGFGSFNIHSATISEIIDNDTNILGSNLIEIGYPDILSASNVIFNVTHYDYSGSVINSTRRLNQKSYLNYLNNTNISGTYLKFDFELYTNDLIYYPPIVQYFRLETYPSTNNTTVLTDSSGSDYTIYSNSSSMVYLPERTLTPTIFLKENSGIKLEGNILEFDANIYQVPLDPRNFENLHFWIDSRFPTGLRRVDYLDDSRMSLFKDLSEENHQIVQSLSDRQPIYREQSINLFTSAQLSGSDDGELKNIVAINSNIFSSTLNVSGGNRSIQIKPNGSSNNSYINIGNNTASITVGLNQDYTVVGTISLNKKQTASALHENARRIVVYTSENGVETLAAISSPAPNLPGTYSLSTTFSTTLLTKGAFVRYYNGSFSLDDSVYWDNLGLYSFSSSISIGSGGAASFTMPILEWRQPLTDNFDSPVVKFNGNEFFTSNVTLNKPYTLYIVGKFFKENAFLSSGDDIYPFIIRDNQYYIYSSSVGVPAINIDQNNIYTFMSQEGNTKLYINGIKYQDINISVDDLTSIIIGKGVVEIFNTDGGLATTASFTDILDGGIPTTASFSSVYNGGFVDDYFDKFIGDINSVLSYKSIHDDETRIKIERWLAESFNIPAPISW